jgi:hypothetical protein
MLAAEATPVLLALAARRFQAYFELVQIGKADCPPVQKAPAPLAARLGALGVELAKVVRLTIADP